MRGNCSGLTDTQPASCSAAMPLPVSTIASTAIRIELAEKNVASGKRRLVLERLAQDFEPGRHYSEREVNAVLRERHPGVAALRRYLVDEGFMDRIPGEYWRSGGLVDVDI